ncbi:SDR family NAD(P)-dependent oxidoreductase [Eilatimonas milleporae]|uniref:3-oxoacyl-[acyl-carrier protein] reductase n=1 Tax=Eilatimonas milleporae TaxID=911205 RepID=A0A3M0CRD7_9PROT|nr:SDR family oxidoreductase [Eilatimonas milleporae]RMB12111.1 3-oxoacyl-[acyl-carrier protein] reductase [Eilatimonas milleporae]
MTGTAAALDGKRAVVTGTASGIGEAIARAFLSAGARVLAVDLPQSNVGDVYADHAGAVPMAQDITEAAAPDAIAARASEALGGLDILVNNAGIAHGGSIETTTDALWDRVMGVNVTAMFKITRAALPLLKESGAGRIINLGSIMSDMGGPELFVYGTSKHAVAGMTKSMAVDLGRYGITANYLQPGAVVTALSAPFFEDEAFRTYWVEKAPVGRLGVPTDVAAAALFLAGDDAGFISGVGLNVDGGAIVKF